MRYMVLFIASTQAESDAFFTEIHHYQWKPTDPPHTMDILALHPTLHSNRNGIWQWSNGHLTAAPLVTSSASTWRGQLEDLLDHVPAGPFDGFLYSGHASGIALGRWIRNGSPFFLTRKLIDLFQARRLTFPVLFFQSCYMGTLPALLECHRISPWVVADPGYSAWESLTATRAFWNPTRHKGTWLRACVTEYARRYPASSCYQVFDVSDVPHLLQHVKGMNPLQWDWAPRWRLSSYDPSTYDWISVVEHAEEKGEKERKLLSLLKRMMRYSHPCRKKKGPSLPYGRIRHMEHRYEGSSWWSWWKSVQPQSVPGTHA